MVFTIGVEKREKKMKHKFGAKKCEVDGLKFPSKLERSYYMVLKKMKDAGLILFFLRQVPFLLPGNVTYRLDYMVFYAPTLKQEFGDIEFVETKGYMTPDAAIKIKQTEDLYNIKIKIVSKI